MTVEVWGDGSSTGRPDREWGWGFVIAIDGIPVCCDFGGGPSGTNNVAEMEALVQGILCYADMVQKHPEWPLGCIVVSDSMYALGQATGRQQAYKNVEKATQLRALYDKYCTGARHVRGHTGEHLNERADMLSKRGKALYAKKKETILSIEEELANTPLELKHT